SMLSNNPQFSQSGNLLKVESALTTLLALTALYGTAAALLRQDWRVLPLLGWLLATAFLLWRQVPLFSHHFVSLTPPLIALSVMGIADPSDRKSTRLNSSHRTISYAVFCLKKKKTQDQIPSLSQNANP